MESFGKNTVGGMTEVKDLMAKTPGEKTGLVIFVNREIIDWIEKLNLVIVASGDIGLDSIKDQIIAYLKTIEYL
ncbi:MAG: hypothetical protein ACKO96_36720, partial [Flammeovirgaceae bacterium]